MSNIKDTTMITDELNEKVVNYIIRDVELTINRLGINATLFIRKDEDYRGNAFEKLVSTSFQTMPVLFREIHIEADAYIKDMPERPDDYMYVTFNLRYYYRTFDSGTNGCELGTVTYQVDKHYNKNGKDTKYMSMYIQKTQSIEI